MQNLAVVAAILFLHKALTIVFPISFCTRREEPSIKIRKRRNNDVQELIGNTIHPNVGNIVILHQKIYSECIYNLMPQEKT